MDGHHRPVLLSVWSMDQHQSLDSLFPLSDGAMTKSEMEHIKLLQNFDNAKNFFIAIYKKFKPKQVGNFTKKIILYPYILDKQFHTSLWTSTDP